MISSNPYPQENERFRLSDFMMNKLGRVHYEEIADDQCLRAEMTGKAARKRTIWRNVVEDTMIRRL